MQEITSITLNLVRNHIKMRADISMEKKSTFTKFLLVIFHV